jgi:hypothetical protein
MGIICSSDDACIFSLPFLVLRGVVFLGNVGFVWVWIGAFCTSERALDDIALRGEKLVVSFLPFLGWGHNRA